MNNKKVILIIMDGWGLGKVASADAINIQKHRLLAPYTKNILTLF